MKKLFNGFAVLGLLLLFVAATAQPVLNRNDESVAKELCFKCTGDPAGAFNCVKIDCPKQIAPAN